jgi:chromosome segregation ATPase
MPDMRAGVDRSSRPQPPQPPSDCDERKRKWTRAGQLKAEYEGDLKAAEKPVNEMNLEIVTLTKQAAALKPNALDYTKKKNELERRIEALRAKIAEQAPYLKSLKKAVDEATKQALEADEAYRPCFEAGHR